MDLAVLIIEEYPGLTAQKVAREALDNSSDLSDAIDPEHSLASTLNKQVQTGLEKRIKRERIKGVYCYFPASKAQKADSREEIITQLSLSAEALKDINNLVALGKVCSRNDAILWLVLEGIKAKRPYLDKLADVRNQIECLKKEVADM